MIDQNLSRHVHTLRVRWNAIRLNFCVTGGAGCAGNLLSRHTAVFNNVSRCLALHLLQQTTQQAMIKATMNHQQMCTTAAAASDLSLFISCYHTSWLLVLTNPAGPAINSVNQYLPGL